MDTDRESAQYVRQARALHLVIYWLALSGALAYCLVYFLLGSRPSALLQLLWGVTFLLALVCVPINIAITELGWDRRLLPLVLFALGLLGAGQVGYSTRAWRFQQDLPRLSALVSDIRAGRPPAQGTLSGAKGKRQLVVVVGGYYMTDFLAYIWREDGKRPTEARRYRIDNSDSVKARGNGWYEAMVSNGH